MQKPLTYALLLATTLGLTACGEKSDKKVEPAASTAAPATQSIESAAKQAGEAVEQKAAEVTEQAADTAKEAGAAVEQKAAEATEQAAGAVEEKAAEVKEEAAKAADQGEEKKVEQQ